MFRDDGGVVRCPGPAFVLSVLVEPGDRVAEGDPLAVVESMKMENTIAAPFAGTVASVETAANMQVEAGAPLVRIATSDTDQSQAAGAVDFAGLAAAELSGTARCEQVYEALRSYLLGYDLDPGSVQTMLTRQRELSETAAPADTDLLRCEDDLLDLFADVGSLYRPRGEIDPEVALVTGSTQEYLLSYLQWLDADRAGLPDSYRRRLERALQRYGVTWAGTHAGARRSRRLDVPLVPPGRRPGACGYRDSRAPAPPPAPSWSHARRRRDADTARPAGGRPGPPAGGRGSGPRRSVPLLRRAAAGGRPSPTSTPGCGAIWTR